MRRLLLFFGSAACVLVASGTVFADGNNETNVTIYEDIAEETETVTEEVVEEEETEEVKYDFGVNCYENTNFPRLEELFDDWSEDVIFQEPTVEDTEDGCIVTYSFEDLNPVMRMALTDEYGFYLKKAFQGTYINGLNEIGTLEEVQIGNVFFIDGTSTLEVIWPADNQIALKIVYDDVRVRGNEAGESSEADNAIASENEKGDDEEAAAKEPEESKEYSDQETIAKVQNALNALGFDCGVADGISGNKTRSAVRAYREANGLGSSEAINDELLNSLGLS